MALSGPGGKMALSGPGGKMALSGPGRRRAPFPQIAGPLALWLLVLSVTQAFSLG